MKPIVKICIALSAVLFLLGTVGVGVGTAMGVPPSDLLYSGHFPGRFTVRTEPESLPEPGSLKDPEDLPDTEIPEISSLQGTPLTDCEEYYEFRDITAFDMELSLCRLHILSHEKDYVAVCADNVLDTFRCRQEAGTLLLSDNRPDSTKSNSMDRALRLDLYLPVQDYEEFCIDLSAGSLTLDALTADSLEIDQGVGNLTIQTLSCRDLSIDTGVGEFQAESIQVFGEAGIEVGTGNITIARFDGEELDLECGVGNAEITAAGRETDYNYRLTAALGSIYLNHHQQEHPQSHHSSHDSDDYCLDIHHGAGRSIQIMCGLGNAELNFTEETFNE